MYRIIIKMICRVGTGLFIFYGLSLVSFEMSHTRYEGEKGYDLLAESVYVTIA